MLTEYPQSGLGITHGNDLPYNWIDEDLGSPARLLVYHWLDNLSDRILVVSGIWQYYHENGLWLNNNGQVATDAFHNSCSLNDHKDYHVYKHLNVITSFYLGGFYVKGGDPAGTFVSEGAVGIFFAEPNAYATADIPGMDRRIGSPQ